MTSEHVCIVQWERDDLAFGELYRGRCRCHMDKWRIWKRADPSLACPVSGALILNEAVVYGEALGGGGEGR